MSFNEAAGIPRGRLSGESASVVKSMAASMRPRVFPAEDAGVVHRPADVELRFNEAAGIPRGRPAVHARRPLLDIASMRPRVFPAEDGPDFNEEFAVGQLQ